MKFYLQSRILVGCLSILFSLYFTSATAVTLSLSPGSQTGAPGDTVSLDLVIDGLGDFAPDSLGDFDIDIAYDTSALSLAGFVLGNFLGDTGLFEALDFSQGDPGGTGIVNLSEVSLLSPDELDGIQPYSFTLATLDFHIDSLAPGASTLVGIDTVLSLGDGYGHALTPDATSGAVIRRPAGGPSPAPAPGSLLLLVAGLGALRALRGRTSGSM